MRENGAHFLQVLVTVQVCLKCSLLSNATCSEQILRFIVFSNLTPLLIKAKSKQLSASDADRQWIASTAYGDIMQRTLTELPSDLRRSRPGYAFCVAVWHVTGRRYLVCGVLRLFNDCFMMLGPLCLRGLISSMAPV